MKIATIELPQHIVAKMFFIIVCKGKSIGSTTIQNAKKKSGGNTSNRSMEEAGHNVYSNPFNKKPYAISQLKTTDADLIGRRLQMMWFEEANIQLRYF